MSDIDVTSNNHSEQEDDDSCFEQECVLFVASLKCQTEEIIVLMMIERTLWSECLSLYYEKTVQEHLDFYCSAETMFLFTLKNYSTNEAKILYTMQFLISKSHNIWYHHYATISLKNKSWKYFTQYLLDIVENLMNCQLHFISNLKSSSDFETQLKLLKELRASSELTLSWHTQLWVLWAA